MNIILVPGGNRHGRSASFTQKQIIALLVAAVALPTLFGVLAFQAASLLHGGGRRDALARLAEQRAELGRQQTVIEQARNHTQTHLDALAQRMGQLQAEILRLNALGDRVAHIAGVDSHEFDFRYTQLPKSADDSIDDDLSGDFLSTLDELNQRVGRQRKELSTLETALAHGKGGSVRQIQDRMLADDLGAATTAAKPKKSSAAVSPRHRRRLARRPRSAAQVRKDKLVSYVGPRMKFQTSPATRPKNPERAGNEPSHTVGLAEASHDKKTAAVRPSAKSPSPSPAGNRPAESRTDPES
jgi:uncharacterized small protein (DUF1192 family)